MKRVSDGVDKCVEAQPDVYAVQGYDAAQLYQAGLNAAGGDPTLLVTEAIHNYFVYKAGLMRHDLERLLKRELDSTVMPGFEPMQTRPTPKVATPVRRSRPRDVVQAPSFRPQVGRRGLARP